MPGEKPPAGTSGEETALLREESRCRSAKRRRATSVRRDPKSSRTASRCAIILTTALSFIGTSAATAATRRDPRAAAESARRQGAELWPTTR